MKTSLQQPDGWSCHWLSYGKLVLETGAVRPGTEHALNGLSRGFPDPLRRVIDLETLFGSGIEASQVVADNRLDTGAFVYTPIFVPDEDGAGDVGYAVFLRISAPGEAGIDNAARRFTQFSALAVPLAEWCPDLVLAACLGLFDDVLAQPLREMRRDADPVRLPRPRILSPPVNSTVAVSSVPSAAVRVDMPQVSTAVGELRAWMAEVAAGAPVPAKGQVLSLASLPIGLGLRAGRSLLGVPIAIRDRADAAGQGQGRDRHAATAGDSQAGEQSPLLPDLLPLSRIVTQLGRPAWMQYWGLTAAECIAEIESLADVLAEEPGHDLNRRTVLLLETCFPFGSTLLGHEHPFADCSVADVLRRLRQAVQLRPDFVAEGDLKRWTVLLAPWMDDPTARPVVARRTEPLDIFEDAHKFDYLSNAQIDALSSIVDIVMHGLRAPVLREEVN